MHEKINGILLLLLLFILILFTSGGETFELHVPEMKLPNFHANGERG